MAPPVRSRAAAAPAAEPDWSKIEPVAAAAEPDWSKVEPITAQAEPDWNAIEPERPAMPDELASQGPPGNPNDDVGLQGGLLNAAYEASGLREGVAAAKGALKRAGQGMIQTALGYELTMKGNSLKQIRESITPEIMESSPEARERMKLAYADYFDVLNRIDASRSLQAETVKGKGTKAIEAIDPSLGYLEKGGAYLRALKSDPLGIVRDISLENGPMLLEMVLAGVLTGGAGPVAAASSAGAVSAANEFPNRYVDLRERGLKHEEAWQQAGVATGLISVMDAVSFRAAGKAFDKLMQGGPIQQLVGAVGGTAEQAIYGAGGEAYAQLGLEAMNRGTELSGQFFDPVALGQEAVGEVAGVFTEGAANPRAPGAAPFVAPGAGPQPIPPAGPPPSAPAPPPAAVQPVDVNGEDMFGPVQPGAEAPADPLADTQELPTIDEAGIPTVDGAEPPLGDAPVIDEFEPPMAEEIPGPPPVELAPDAPVEPPVQEGAEAPVVTDDAAAGARERLKKRLKPAESAPAAAAPPEDAADLQALKDEFRLDERGGKMLRRSQDPDDPGYKQISRTIDLGPEVWMNRPRGGAPRPGQPEGPFELSVKQAKAAVDKAIAGKPLGEREQRFIDHARRHLRGENSYQQDDYVPPPVDDTPFTDALVERDDVGNRFAGLMVEASKYADQDEIEAAMDGPDDDAAEARIRAIIERGKANAAATSQTAATEEKPSAVQAPGEGAAGARDAAPEAPGELTLTAQTEESRRAEEARIKAADKAKKQAEAKAQSEIDAKNFDLTGSARPSDALPGQADITQRRGGGIAGEDTPAGRASLQRTLETAPQVPFQRTSRGSLSWKPDDLPKWTPIGNGFSARQYVLDGRPIQEVRHNESDAIITRGLDTNGRPYAEMEATSTLDDVMSGRAWSAFEGFFEGRDSKKLPSPIDAAANQAATSPANDLPQPTEAQKEAGNYKKGHVRIQGLDIAIENPKGSKRSGTDRSGKSWEVEMPAHYGYIKGTVGKDKDHIDVYLGPFAEDAEAPVFIVNQQNKSGGFDEHKVFIGWGRLRDVEDTYRAAFSSRALADSLMGGEPVRTTMKEFQNWLADGDTTKPFGTAQSNAAEIDAHIAEYPGSSPSNAENIPGNGLAAMKQYEDGLERAGWERKGKDWVKGDRSLFLRGQGESSAAIVQWKDGAPKADKALLIPQRTEGGGIRITTKPAVSENTIVTEDAAAAARERLRAKLRGSTPTSGVDPEVLKDGMLLSAYHIERGARTFAAYAKAMLEDMGDIVRPYLKSWYMAVKFDPSYAKLQGEMDGAAAVESASVDDAPAPAAPPAAQPTREDGVLAIFRGLLRSKHQLADYRRMYMVETGEKLDGPAIKRVDELVELAIVRAAREIAASDRTAQEKYDELVALYGRQPKLSTRTSTSIQNQAYSTPAPLAYLASRIAGITKDTFVYEPTAGNGMLLLEAGPKNTHAVELNEDRARQLAKLGFSPVIGDAMWPSNAPDHQQDVVIANPPFGVLKGEKGMPIRFNVDTPGQSNFVTNEIDHAIAMTALKRLKADGRAVLILGGISKQLQGEARAKAYEGAAKRDFFFRLYKRYNVTDHFTVAGELYAKQGAEWPVDVIVIEGTTPSEMGPPFVKVPRVYASWADLKGLLDGPRSVQPTAESQPEGAGADQRLRNPQPAPVADGASGVAGRPAARPDQPVPGSAPSGEAPGAGPRGPGPVAPRPSAEGQGGARDGGRQPAADGAARPAERPAEPVPRPDSGAQQLGAKPPAGGAVGPGASAPAVVVPPTDVAPTDSQQPYQPQSEGGTPIGTLLPVNMASAIQEALINLEGRVGPLDDFVAAELGWTKEQTLSRLASEQIDAVASAIDQIKNGKGFIIGDQTGVGKGRVVASIMRWALRNGRIPMFFTEKALLYKDIYRDLTDIGQEDIRPLMTNAATSVALDDEGNARLKTKDAKTHNAMLAGLAETGSLGDYNIVFSTYSQMQGAPGAGRRAFGLSLAGRAVVIVDESHNAGGQDAGRKSAKQAEMDGTQKEGRAKYFRTLIGLATGTFYSSATYAKRPEVMDLYSATDMKLAVEGNVNKLPAAIQRGGVPLQQVVASMLAKSGQYMRREKSFAGINYNTPVVPVDSRIAAAMADVMSRVVEFDTMKKGIVDTIRDGLDDSWATIAGDTNEIGAPSVQSTNFTSIMHNLIDQSLLSMKAQPALEKAIEALKRGEKPVVTVSNTMGQFVEDYADQAGLQPGDLMALSFKALLKAYLDKSRTVRIKDGGSDTVRRVYLSDEQLGPSLLKAYKEIAKLIEDSDILETIPVSPIDYIHAGLKRAGYSSSEITGRTHAVDYADGLDKARYRIRPQKEKSIDGKNGTIRDFNSGALDVIVLNQSGSTGLSLHASSKFKDRRKRRMIIAQAEKNIDTHMQMLGRINRTGQVVLPEYDQLVADIPAEKRPAAVLAKKMASLNANTTASRTSALTSKEVVDFLNVYGDEVVAQMMTDMPELHEQLGNPLKWDEDKGGFMREDAARKVTGRLPLIVDVEEQGRIYDMIEEGYNEMLAHADATGENVLEAKTLDLGAKVIGRSTLFEGTTASSSPFAMPAYLELVDAKRLGKPYTWAQVEELVRKERAAEGYQSWDALMARGLREFTAYRDAELTRLEAMAEQAAADAAEGEKDVERVDVEGRMAALDDLKDRWLEKLRIVVSGMPVRIETATGDVYYGRVLRVQQKKGVKNPVALGSWSATIAVTDGAKTITVPFSRFRSQGSQRAAEEGLARIAPWDDRKATETGDKIADLFEKGQNVSREERVIVTGNLMAGFAAIRGGIITNYTDAAGAVRQGILMPRNFDIGEFAEAQPVEFPDARSIVEFLRSTRTAIVRSTDGNLQLQRLGDDWMVATPRSKAEGGRYFLDQGLRRITGDFTSSGSFMRAKMYSSQRFGEAIAYLQREMGIRFRTDTYKDEAVAAGGKQMSGKMTRVKDDAPGRAEDLGMDLAERGEMRKVLPDIAMLTHLNKVFRGATFRWQVIDPANPPAAHADYMKMIRKRGLHRRWRGGLNRDAATGELVILLARGRFESLADLERTALHEATHFGLYSLFGRSYQDFTTKLYNSQGRSTFKDRIERYYGKVQADGTVNTGAFDQDDATHRMRVVDEFLADLGGRIGTQTVGNRMQAIWDSFIVWLQDALAARGFRTRHGMPQLRAIARRGLGAAFKQGGQAYETATPGAFAGETGLALEEEDRGRQGAIGTMASLFRNGQPIDKAFRMVTSPLGLGNVRDSRWHASTVVREGVRRGIAHTQRAIDSGRLPWLVPALTRGKAVSEHLLAGFVDRYNTPAEFIAREQQRDTGIRIRDAAALKLGQDLSQILSGPDEVQMLQAAITGEEVNNEVIERLAQPIIASIDDMAQELVALGQLSRESYERNKKKYLHRMYEKFEFEEFGLGAWGKARKAVHNFADSRRSRIQGDIFKGRGIFWKAKVSDLRKHVGEEWWGQRMERGKPDVRLGAQKWRVLDQLQGNTGEQDELISGGKKKARVVDRVYWPADEPVPSRFAGYEERGVFETRSLSTGEVTLWRDYTKAERLRMGEILDSRYTIVKTFMLMTRDLETGRFFQDIAANEDWARREVPLNENGDEDFTEARDLRRHSAYVGVRWVKVPDSVIPKTGGVKRYGALAGMYVKAEIWRDLAEHESMKLPSMWRAILRTWKTWKTAYNPTVHFNNVVSNFLLADMMDVTWTDLMDGLRSYLNKDASYNDAYLHGLFSGTYTGEEIQREYLEPLLKKLVRETDEAGSPPPTLVFFNRLRRELVKAGPLAKRAYEFEDALFRMGAYTKLIRDGYTPNVAALKARRQFIDYDIRAPYINALRNTILPFVSYPYRLAPLLAEAVSERPYKLIKYATLGYMLSSAYFWITGDDDEDDRKFMDPALTGLTWFGAPQALRVGTDRNDNPIFLDIRRLVPGGDLFDMGGNAAVPWLPSTMVPGGPLMIGVEMVMNKSQFTQRPIADYTNDSAAENTGDVALHLWRSSVPNLPFIPYTWANKKVVDAMTGKMTRTGQEQSTGMAIASAVGIKLTAQNLRENIDRREREVEDANRDLRGKIKALEGRYRRERSTMTRESYLAQRGEYEARIRRNNEQWRDKDPGGALRDARR